MTKWILAVCDEAFPKSLAELEGCDPDPTVVERAVEREISTVVHFTTNLGALGILASEGIKCRTDLPQDKYLEHVYKPNAIYRRLDAEWCGYVNLSMMEINSALFKVASEKWHAQDGVSWVVFNFSVEILGAAGVVFTTTNNIYPAVLRSEGLCGLERMFDPTVLGRCAREIRRTDHQPTYSPTDPQAEVLYPGTLGLEHLTRIDVQDETSVDNIRGQLYTFGIEADVCYSPQVFE